VTSYLIAAVICFCIGWSIAAAEALFRLEHRPPPFQNRPGMLFLLTLAAVGAALGTGGILWAFQAIPSSAVMIVIAGAGWAGFAASDWLNVSPAGAVNRLILGLSAVLVLYGLVWKFLPPQP
jgi:hypothetical protein